MSETLFLNTTENADGVPEVSPGELQTKLGHSQLEIVDVRQKEEFTGELKHIPGSKLLTLETEFEVGVDQLDQNKTLVFVCRSGQRSARATMIAQAKGFRQVFNLEGGMLKWNALDLPLE